MALAVPPALSAPVLTSNFPFRPDGLESVCGFPSLPHGVDTAMRRRITLRGKYANQKIGAVRGQHLWNDPPSLHTRDHGPAAHHDRYLATPALGAPKGFFASRPMTETAQAAIVAKR